VLVSLNFWGDDPKGVLISGYQAEQDIGGGNVPTTHQESPGSGRKKEMICRLPNQGVDYCVWTGPAGVGVASLYMPHTPYV
jgi:hypothetical protein